MLGTPCLINSLHWWMHHSTPNASVSSSVLHFSASIVSSCGMSTLNVFGTIVSCDCFRNGFIPGMIGMFIPSFAVVIEQLCNCVFGSCFHFLFQPKEVLFQVGSFFVLFGIASNTIAEWSVGNFNWRTVHEQSFVEVVDLLC